MAKFATPMRDPSQFASAFTRWVYEEVPVKMYFADVDGLAYAKSHQCMRGFEWKYPDARLSPGQRAILPLLDRMMDSGRLLGWLAPDSGVYVIRGTPPFTDGAWVEQPWVPRRAWVSYDDLLRLLSCQPYPDLWAASPADG